MDRLRTEHASKLQVIQVDVTTDDGQELARRMRFQFTPTFIFFDRAGRESWRSVGSLDPGRVRESLRPESGE